MTQRQAKTTRSKATEAGGDRANLDRQYGSIGISAVAAALPFVGETKTPSQGSGDREDDEVTRARKHSVLAV